MAEIIVNFEAKMPKYLKVYSFLVIAWKSLIMAFKQLI